MQLVIIAAGKGSRMGDISIPKALLPLNGISNLENTINNIGKHFDEILIFITDSAVYHFSKFIKEKNCKNINLFTIPSGFGSGHAVMTALKNLTTKTKMRPFILSWGDIYFKNDELIKELLNEIDSYENLKQKPALVIPTVKEDHPYISISADEELNAQGITFNDSNPGLHDQSVFLILNPKELHKRLHEMHNTIWNMDSYITDIKEFGFLQVIPYMWNIKNPAKVYITENALQSFNTLEELKQIENQKYHYSGSL